MEIKQPPTVAWVPWRDGAALEDGLTLAVPWIEKQAAAQHSAPSLFVEDLHVLGSNRRLEAFVAKHGHRSTMRSPTTRQGRGPVLAWMPDFKGLQQATAEAARSALCVIEWGAPPWLEGWAAATGALDLSQPDADRPEVDPRLDELLDRLAEGGYNGYGSAPGVWIAPSVLGDIRDAGHLDKDYVLAVMATKVHHHKLKDLGRLIDRLPPG